MRFSALLKSADLPARRRGDTEISDVQADSRRCAPGSCFVAVRGVDQDGHQFIPSAVSAGCEAVVCEDASSLPDGLPRAVVDDSRVAVARLAQAVRDWPGRKLNTVAITGTNGKTTVAYLTRAALAAAGESPAMLGTVCYDTGERSVAAGTTTPDPVSLAEMCQEMTAAGRTHLVMEASSHALDQRRIAGIEPAVGVFTNLSGDHLDYHRTMEEYLAAKRRLFEQLDADATAVINRDDPSADALAGCTRARVLWYGLSPAADLYARIDRIDESGTQFALVHQGRTVPAGTRLIGRHNVFNYLAAAGACIALGVDVETVAAALGEVENIPGRLARVDAAAPYQVFVDYAHTDDALENVLGSLRPIARGRIIVVFGCGGDRDRSKRPRMAKVAEDLADLVVVTSDNPRSEEPEAIIDEILVGFSRDGRARAIVEPDRSAAIDAAIARASDGDIVLIAGKGHETYQIVGDRKIHFDDVEQAGEAIRRREAIR